MADALDNLALNYTKTLVSIPSNAARGGAGRKAEELRRQLAPVISKYLRGNELTSEEQAIFNRTSLKGKSPVQVFREAGYTVRDTQDLLKAQAVFRGAMREKKPVIEEQTDNIPNVSRSSTQPAEPTGPEGQQGTAGTGSGSMESTGGGIRGFSRKEFRGMTPEQRRAVIARDDEVAANVSKGMSGDVKSQLALPQTKKSALDRARETLAGDTYQLGSSSILTAAREMRKPTPFKQRTEEQVAARNLVVRDRMAREQQQNKATALNRAKSRMRDVATSQKGAQQFFADTGVSPRRVRAMSGERMPERRRTYEAPKEPPSLKSMIEEQRELDKKRRNR